MPAHGTFIATKKNGEKIGICQCAVWDDDVVIEDGRVPNDIDRCQDDCPYRGILVRND